MEREQKWERLKAILSDMESAVLAYSGGVDSSLLLKAAAEVIGPHLIAATAVSETYHPDELIKARAFVQGLGVTHRIIRSEELASVDFTSNSPDRCYYCKKELFTKLRAIADTEGIAAILDGSNRDDLGDHRPGRRAAAECSVRSPLVEAEFTKADVRSHARRLGLPMWDKPSLACLSSRIPYGTPITGEVIKTIRSAEDALHRLGFGQVRVRHYGETARIEIERDEFVLLLSGDIAERVVLTLKEVGYTYVSLDLEGYRTGSMNEVKKVDSRQ